MTFRFILSLFAFFLIVSCSSDGSDDTNDDEISMEDDGMISDDSDDGPDDTSDEAMDDIPDDGTTNGEELIGLWVLSEIRLDNGVDDFTLALIELAVADLVGQECYLLSFNFMEDGTAEIESRMGDSELEGIEIICPEGIESTTVDWELDGDQLTLVDELEGSETITIVFEDENTIVIEGEDGIDEEFEGSEAVFTRLPD